MRRTVVVAFAALACSALVLTSRAQDGGRDLEPRDAERAKYKSYAMNGAFFLDAWKEQHVPYDIQLIGRVSQPDHYFKVFFTAQDFNRLKKAPIAATRFTISREEQKAELIRLLRLGDTGDTFYFEFAKEIVSNLAFYVGIANSVLTIIDAHPEARRIQRKNAELRTLLALGGEIVYTEALTQQSPWVLTRQLYYKVNVGAEQRVVLLWAASYPAEIE